MATKVAQAKPGLKSARWRLISLVASVAVVAGGGICIGLASSLPDHDAEADVAPTRMASLDASDASAREFVDEPVEVFTVTAQTTSSRVQAQLDYVNSYWQDYNDAYGVIDGNDCVNFASQSLLARGWVMDDGWWSDSSSDSFDFSSPWVSSTSFRDYLEESGRATALTDAQRELVKLGDIVQFDWDNSGDRDHTAVVTRIERTGGTIAIYYGGHTDDTDFRSVDWAIDVNHPGATAYYWSIPE